MAGNGLLLLIPFKPEFLCFGTTQQPNTIKLLNSVHLGKSFTQHSTVQLIIWVMLFPHSSMNSKHRSARHHIYDIVRIVCHIPLSILVCLANALLCSCLDYCNSCLIGISKDNLITLHVVQNTLARAITRLSQYQHKSPVIKYLHWLPIQKE